MRCSRRLTTLTAFLAAALLLPACGYRIGTTDHGGEAEVVPFERGCEGLRSDDITIHGVELHDRTLRIHYAHGVGCAEHSYRVCGANAILRTDPGLWSIHVLHDANGDECEAERLGVIETEIPPGRNLIGLGGLEGRSFTIDVD